MAEIKLDVSAMKKYANRLEELRRSALPRAVMNTLNNAAFDLKTNTMPAKAKSTFVERKKTFFKANSKVQKATPGTLRSMKSIVGFVPKDKAVEELEQQEHGGKIGGRSFITTKHARTGKSWSKMVRPKDRITAIKNIINAEDVKAKNRKQKFIRSVFMAQKLFGKSGYVLGNKNNGSQTLSRINNVKKTKRNKLRISRTPLYTYKQGRTVPIKATHFMKRASLESGAKLPKYFNKNAQIIIEKYTKTI